MKDEFNEQPDYIKELARSQGSTLQPEMELPEIEEPEAPVEPQAPDYAARLNDARKADNKQQFYGDLLRSFQTMIQGAAPNSGFKADMGVADSISSRAGQAVKAVKEDMEVDAAAKKAAREDEKFGMEKERFDMSKEKHASDLESSKLQQDKFQLELQKADLDFTDMQANRDPSSNQSKIAQDRVLEVRRKMGQNVNEATIRSMSAEELFKLNEFLQDDLVQYYKDKNAALDRASREEIAGEKTKLAQQKADEKSSKEDHTRRRQLFADATKALTTDARFKKALDQSIAFDEVNSLLKEVEAGNGHALNTLGSKLARAMGEVGVLTDTDVVRYLKSAKWTDSLQEWYKKGMEGELPPGSLENIKKNVGELKKALNSSVGKVVRNATGRLQATYPDIDEAIIGQVLGFGELNQTPEPKMVKMKAPNGKIVKVPESEVEKAKAAGGEVI